MRENGFLRILGKVTGGRALGHQKDTPIAEPAVGAPRDRRRVTEVVERVEAGDQVVAALFWQLISRHRHRLHIGEALVGRPRNRPLGERRVEIVPGNLPVGEGLRQDEHDVTVAAGKVGDPPTAGGRSVSPGTNPIHSAMSAAA